MGMQSYTLSIGLHDGHEALALTAAKRVTNGNTQYQLYLPYISPTSRPYLP